MTTISDNVPKVSDTHSAGYAPCYKIHMSGYDYVRPENYDWTDDYDQSCDDEDTGRDMLEMIYLELVPHLIEKYGNKYSEAINSLTEVLLRLYDPIEGVARIKWAFNIPENQLIVRDWSRSQWYFDSPYDNDCEDYAYERYLESKKRNKK